MKYENSKSPYGPEDEIGRLNEITAASRRAVVQRVDGSKIIDLSVDYFVGIPSWDLLGDPPYQIWMTHMPQGSLVDNSVFWTGYKALRVRLLRGAAATAGIDGIADATLRHAVRLLTDLGYAARMATARLMGDVRRRRSPPRYARRRLRAQPARPCPDPLQLFD